ncbi:MAG: 50S ribosomal protein L22 [Candidatus Pacebacteria bacterium]|nr:50S ribosomal protein L22 [Candidatus Paceibacterota bacterium]
MTEIKAKLKNYRQSPRKVRLVANLIKGKKVEKVISELTFLNKRVSAVMKKLVESAIANAKHNNKINKEDLYIKEITVNEGPPMKRFRAGAKGRAFPYKKRTSHIDVVLEERKEVKKEVEKTEKAVEKKETKVKK